LFGAANRAISNAASSFIGHVRSSDPGRGKCIIRHLCCSTRCIALWCSTVANCLV
jgi:hypothetical protein